MGRSDPGKKKPTDTMEGFERLLRLLDPDRDMAGVKYEEVRRRLAYYFRKHGCLTPEDQADKTITRASDKLARGEEVKDIRPYLYGVAFYILKEYWDTAGRESEDIDGLPASREPVDDPRATERERNADRTEQLKTECMRQCLNSLPDDDRTLVTEYSENRDKGAFREQLASSRGMALSALRVRIHRIREKLKKCVDDCLGNRIASEI
ncbi:MAG: hypothetical protein ACREDR_36520 [Blastocatellia bacterium]